MNKAIIGRKLGMSQYFTPEGIAIPVTVVEAGPCPVVQVKTVEKDGYKAVQLGFGGIKEKNVNKPMQGVFKKANVTPTRILREFRLEDAESYEVGSTVTVEKFQAGDVVDVSGTTRGRGFTGAVYRWNQHILRRTHGTGPVHREVGSMGPNSTPSRVFKGKNLAGHYGCEAVTILNLKVVKVDAARNVLLIKGAIPGPKGSFVTVKSAVKTQKN